MRSHFVAGVALVFFGFSGQALTKVTAAEAERLGGDLTSVGAERAGNRSASIPEWTGGFADLQTWPMRLTCRTHRHCVR